MTQTRLGARLNQNNTRPLATAPGMYRALAAILGVLGMLAAALYLAPQTAALGLVLLGLGLPVVLLLWHRPEFGLLAILFLAANFLPLDLVDIRLPIGGGLQLRDLLTLGLFGLLVFRGLARKTLGIPWWPVGAPLTVFMVLVLFSAVYALFWQGVTSNWVFAELRDLSAYALFFITAWALGQRHHLVTILVGLFVIANLTAAIIFIQQFLGVSRFLLPAMADSFWGIWLEGGAGSFGSVRVVPPSHVLLYFAMLIAAGLAMFESNRRLRTGLVIQFGVLGLALLLTYTRAQWIATAMALVLMATVFVPKYKAQIGRFALLSIPLFLIACGFLGFGLQGLVQDTPVLTLLSDRATTLLTPDETIESRSLQWRIFENEEALKSISRHPLLGVGLGNSYRNLTTLQGEAQGWWTRNSLVSGEVSRFTRYVHSSYLWLPVKLGIPAFAIFLWFCAALPVAGWRLMSSLPDNRMKGIVLAIVTGFIGLLVWTIFHQHLIMNRSSTAVAFVAGLVAGIYSLHSREHGASFVESLPSPEESLNDASSQSST
ncbi:MAG: O-antigen ligase family protein [Anaerolineales bacterium]